MLIPRIQRIKKNLLAALRTITVESGAQYQPTIREADDLAATGPQENVELTLEPTGFDYAPDDETPGGHTMVDLFYQVNILVSSRIENDNTPIDEICLAVCADVERALMADYTQGNEAMNTMLDQAVVNDSLVEGFYAWSLLFKCRAIYAIDDPFSR